MTLCHIISVIMLFALIAGGADGASLAPDFTLSDLSGKKVTLSLLKGNVVLLNFWSTTCGPCREEMPSLNSLYLELRRERFEVLAVSIDPSEKPVRSFSTERKLAFPVLLDKDREVYFDTYGVVGLPVTFLIDKNGVIVEKIMGEQRWDSPQMKDKIMKLLRGK